MKLVLFEEPIFNTIQGEGYLVGTPSTFVRLWGCDFACPWCDTKKSWEPNSKYQEVHPHDVAEKIGSLQLKHVVFTGGNPLLQPEELCETIDMLDARTHITVETQASIYNANVFKRINLASLSPKLYDWRQDVVDEIVRHVIGRGIRKDAAVQMKVVCKDEVDTLDALERFTMMWRSYSAQSLTDRDNIHFILQPEYSTGRAGIKALQSTLESWYRVSRSSFLVRLIPQVHKTSLFVR